MENLSISFTDRVDPMASVVNWMSDWYNKYLDYQATRTDPVLYIPEDQYKVKEHWEKASKEAENALDFTWEIVTPYHVTKEHLQWLRNITELDEFELFSSRRRPELKFKLEK